MKNLFYNRKLVVSIFVVLILVLTAVAIGPIVYSLFKSGGVKTEPVTADGAKAASTPLDGSWSVAKGRADNHTSVGFTFDEVLPAERTSTSGSTTEVTGQAEFPIPRWNPPPLRSIWMPSPRTRRSATKT